METTLYFNYIILEILPNKYFKNVIEFVRYKFDNEEYKDTVFLISTADILPTKEYKEKYKDKRVIMYNWEQLCGGNEWLDVPLYCKNLIGADELWDYDYLNKEYLHQFHNIKVDNVQSIEYIPSFSRIDNSEDPEIDVLFYGLLNERREDVLRDIRYKAYGKFGIVTVSGCSSQQTEKFIANSKIVLNIHAFYPYHRQEQERIAFLLSNKKCVMSEQSQRNMFGDSIIEVPFDKMYDNILFILQNELWRDIGIRGYESFKNQSLGSQLTPIKKEESEDTLKILVTALFVNGDVKEGGSSLFIQMIVDNLRRLGYEVHTTNKPQSKLNENFDLIICSHDSILNTIKTHPATKVCISQGIISTELLQKGADAYYSVSEEVMRINLENGIASDVIGQPVDKQIYTPINEKLKNILIITSNSTKGNVFDSLNHKYNVKYSDPSIPIEDQIKWSDLCITLGRGAVTAMSLGRTVLVADNRYYIGKVGDGYLNESILYESAKCNFSGRRYKIPITDEWLFNELDKYNPNDGKLLYDYVNTYHNSKKAIIKILNDVKHMTNHEPHKSIYGLLRIRNESKIIKDTLDHMSSFCSGIFIYDDCSEDNTVEICKSHPSVMGLIEGKEWKSNRLEEEYKNRQAVLELARNTVEHDCWFIYMDADERIEMDWPEFHRNQHKFDLVTMRLWDFYITQMDKDKSYSEREWIGPEYRDIRFMFRNHPELKYYLPDQRECSFPSHYINTQMGSVKHYGKAIDVEEWESTCDYYIEHFPMYSEKWKKRKGKAIHSKSDFGRDLIKWGDRENNGIKISP